MKTGKQDSKVIVLTGGGTMGHVTPNLALIPRLREKGYDIHYVGTKCGMEKEFIERTGIPYHSISAGKLRRYFDFKNFSDVFKIMKGFAGALNVISNLKPDVVFSKGGFVSTPVVWAAWVKKIPVVIHESDMTPGLANKLSIPFASKICYTFPETGKYFPSEKRIYTGIPVRQELFYGSAEKGRMVCGFNNKKPVLVVIGGSQGSANVNSIVRKSLKTLLDTFQICHICGEGNIASELESMKGYKQFGYVDKELSDFFAMADEVVSRAGATTLFELIALKKPSVLIPLSAGASRGDQILNAESSMKQGFSRVLREEDIDEAKFIKNITDIYMNRDKYIRAMSSADGKGAADKIIKLLDELTKS